MLPRFSIGRCSVNPWLTRGHVSFPHDRRFTEICSHLNHNPTPSPIRGYVKLQMHIALFGVASLDASTLPATYCKSPQCKWILGNMATWWLYGRTIVCLTLCVCTRISVHDEMCAIEWDIYDVATLPASITRFLNRLDWAPEINQLCFAATVCCLGRHSPGELICFSFPYPVAMCVCLDTCLAGSAVAPRG